MFESIDLLSEFKPTVEPSIIMGDDAFIQINHSIEGEFDIDWVLIDEYLVDISSITSRNISNLHVVVIEIDEHYVADPASKPILA